jgi:hypothetical protein
MVRRLLVLGALCALAGSALAGPFSITRIADTSTSVPGSANTFSSFTLVSPDGSGGFAFLAASPGNRGVYLADGAGITKVADTSTLMPNDVGDTVTFGDFTAGESAIPIDDGHVAIFGHGLGGRDPGELLGLYAYDRATGVLSKVVDQWDAVPDTDPSTPTPELFSIHHSRPEGPRMANGHVAFTNWESRAETYAVVDGVLRIVADRDTVFPGGGSGVSSWVRDIDHDGTVLFASAAEGEGRDLYTWSDGTITKVLDTDTPIPGGSGVFDPLNAFWTAVIEDGVIVLKGRGPMHWVGGLNHQHEGIYVLTGAGLVKLVDNGDPVPGLPGQSFFRMGLGRFGYSEGLLGYTALLDPDGDPETRDEYDGLFASLGGRSFKILTEGETLDGRIVRGLQLGEDPVAGGDIAFTAWFEDGTSGVYVARFSEIPEPGSLLLVGLGVAALLLFVRKRRNTVPGTFRQAVPR